MSRTSLTGRFATALAAASALAVAACSDVPVQPDAAGPAPTSPALAQAPAEDDVVAGEVIVKLKDDAALDAVSARHGLAKGRSGYGKAFEILLTGRGNERATSGAPRRRSRRRVRGAELHPPRRCGSDSPLWAFYNPGGLNMQFYRPERPHGLHPGASYASVLDADEDAIEGIAAGGGDVIDRLDRHGRGLQPPRVHRPADRRQGLVQQRQQSRRHAG